MFRTIGVIGAGTMGSGIATALARCGRDVTLVDATTTAARRGVETACGFYDLAVEKGKMTRAEADVAVARLHATAEIAALRDCDLIIEAVFETFEIKTSVLRRLNDVVAAAAVIATNTSALRVSDLATVVDGPARFLGLHYFNPAPINPVVEVVRGEQTDPEIYERCLAFCRETGKTPIACKDSFGFAINRFFIPYGNEAVRLLDEGVGTAAQIDRVAEACLSADSGPFVVMNLVKPRIMYNAQCSLAPHGPFYALSRTFAEHRDADYAFPIEEDSAGSAAADARISDRLRGAVFFTVLQELDEGVASAADIDAGAVLALRFRTPPCQAMDALGPEEVARVVHETIAPYGQAAPRSLERVGRLRC